MAGEEVRLYVIYDIVNDKVRNKVSETCKDFGLRRIQFSGFTGTLTKNKREEFFWKLKDILGKEAGKILIQPVCEKDCASVFILDNKLEESEEQLEAASDANA